MCRRGEPPVPRKEKMGSTYAPHLRYCFAQKVTFNANCPKRRSS